MTENKKIIRNDRRDTDPYELKLIRAGHYLVRESRRKGVTVAERDLFWGACELIWEAKRQYRAELAEKRRLRGIEFAKRFKNANR